MRIQFENSKYLCEKQVVLALSNRFWSVLTGLKFFFENAVSARFASIFLSVLSQNFLKSVLKYVEVYFTHELRRKFKKTDGRDVGIFSARKFRLNPNEIARKRIQLYKYTCISCEKPSDVFQDLYLRLKELKRSSNDRRFFLYAAIFKMPQEESSKVSRSLCDSLRSFQKSQI